MPHRCQDMDLSYRLSWSGEKRQLERNELPAGSYDGLSLWAGGLTFLPSPIRDSSVSLGEPNLLTYLLGLSLVTDSTISLTVSNRSGRGSRAGRIMQFLSGRTMSRNEN